MDIVSLNSTIGKYSTSFKNVQADALVIDPVNPMVLAPELVFAPEGDKLRGTDFTNLSQAVQELRTQIDDFLGSGGTVVSFLRPYRAFCHSQQPELTIGNYDWLWPDAGRDAKLHILDETRDSFELTEYGENTPFVSYLTSKEVRPDASAKGDFFSLAMDSKRNHVAFVLFRKDGKIVFLPKCQTPLQRNILQDAIKNALHTESWPQTSAIKDIRPTWLSNYILTEIEVLEEMLARKESQIDKLEEECEQIHTQLSYLFQLRNSLFSSNAMNLNSAVSTILMQWGMEVYPKDDFIELVSGCHRAMILTSVCEKDVKLWTARKLLRRLPPGCKGILLANAYRNMEPRFRPKVYCSQSLINFARTNDIALISVTDIFNAHKAGQKNFLDNVWNTKGILFSQTPKR